MRGTWVRGIALGAAITGMLLGASPASSAAPPTTWKVQATPAVANFSLDAVACPSKTRCVAVGGSTDEESTVLLVESWDGKTWRRIAVKSPLGKGNGVATLSAVSCPSTTLCVAVGSDSATGATSVSGFAEVYRSGKWVLERAARSAGSLLAVSCPSIRSCVAVGNSDKFQSMAEAWNGSTWKSLKVLAVSHESTLDAISCSSVGRCSAAGNSTNASFAQQALVERLSGSTWHVETTPKVHGVNATVAAISCPAATGCVAAGSYALTGSSGHQVPLAESWNGTAWRLLTTPKVGGSIVNPFFAGLSCTTTKACRAVGSGGDGNLAEAWNGSKWTLQSAADPTSNTGLQAVSCTAGPACTAVGLYFKTPETSTPLAERN